MKSIKSWPLNDKGDELFEESRQEALKILSQKEKEARRLSAASPEAAYERAMSEKYGKKVKIPKVKDLPKEFEKDEAVTVRTTSADPDYTKWQKSIIPQFIKWWSATKHRAGDPITTVKRDDAVAFVNTLCGPAEDGKKRGSDTINRKIKILRKAFRKALPAGAPNPFLEIRTDRIEGDEIIHREPLETLEAINHFLETARKTDPLIYRLATVGIYSALRKGDICELKWSDIHLEAVWSDDKGEKHYGTIIRKLNKTDVVVHIPMFPPLKDLMDLVFTETTDHSGYVFPEAAQLYAESKIKKQDLPPEERTKFKHCGNTILSDHLKKVYTTAFAERKGLTITDADAELVELRDVLDDVKNGLIATGLSESQRTRICAELDAYANRKSFNEIARTLKISKSQIHYDLEKAESVIAPKKFIRYQKSTGPTTSQLIKSVTQKKRVIGAHAASIYDFHALRTTFVTIAHSAGMTLDDIRCITGHTDTKMLEQFYDRTKGVIIAKRFTKAAPQFFRPEEKKTPVTEASADKPSLLPMAMSVEQLKAKAKTLDQKHRKQLLKQAMLIQQALLEADE